MEKFGKVGILVCAILMLMSGCSLGINSEPEKPGDGQDSNTKQVLYPVSVDGKEIRVGESTVQTLLDDGLKVTVAETKNNEVKHYEVDPDTELEPGSYYTGIRIWITDDVYAEVALVTDEKEVRIGEAVIAKMEFHLSGGEKADLDRIVFSGVPASEMTRAKAENVFPDFQAEGSRWTQKGDDYYYDMNFSSGDKLLTDFTLEKIYTVAG